MDIVKKFTFTEPDTPDHNDNESQNKLDLMSNMDLYKQIAFLELKQDLAGRRLSDRELIGGIEQRIDKLMQEYKDVPDKQKKDELIRRIKEAN